MHSSTTPCRESKAVSNSHRTQAAHSTGVKAAGLQAGGKVALGDDAPKFARLIGVGGDGFVGDEVEIALLGPSLALALRARLKSVQNGSCRFSRRSQ
jgi:hypothetical protein